VVQVVDYQPRLRWWNHAWRYALTLFIGGMAWAQIAQWQWHHNRLWFYADFGLGVATLVLCHWRRRYPVTIAVIAALASGLSGSSGGPATLALVSLATRRRWREIIPVAVISLGSSAFLEIINPTDNDGPYLTIPVIVAVVAVTIGWGMYIGSRRELLATLRDRAVAAESEQSARLGQARTAERARIAREMHDVLAHRISLVTMHAGALTYRQDLSADEMRATAGVIQENSHQALVELREVLGILRDGPGDAVPELPQPSAADLPELLIEARRSGMRIETEHGIPLDGIPETLGRTLYRVVQEGLTNARKHGLDTLVTVNLDGGPADGLTVEVRNPLRVGTVFSPSPESGLGLIGLAERTSLAGGRLTHRVSPEREFILSAWLPWPA
jgi:signal transduction histidine kinase